LKALSNSIGSGIMMELNSESPETESLFIAVNKPGGKPAWSGNPTLLQPVKFGLRSLIAYKKLSFELFAANIWNYNNLAKKSVNGTNYLTFDNIDARMYGGNLYFNHPNIDVNVSYVWAKNQTNDSPLSEIPPLSVKTKVISPEYYNIVAYIGHTYNNAQTRIDENLNERTSSAWNKLDFGISYNWSNLNISLDVENLLNSNYYQHLSFLRDPFMANNQVYEPGRVFRITFKTNRLL
jgi:iron complex outermembrane receptor protein